MLAVDNTGLDADCRRDAARICSLPTIGVQVDVEALSVVVNAPLPWFGPGDNFMKRQRAPD